MSLLPIVLAGGALLALAYFTYGRFLARVFHLDERNQTPARTVDDGIDFAPTNKWYLLGQHFSAIAAAGPIVGPILAGLMFGWLPAMIWILVGSILIGGVHDFTSLVASIRHKAKSIAEVVRLNMSQRAYYLFLVFIWLCLVYVIIAFTDVTASAFVSGEEGEGVASASMLYLLLAVILGIVIRRTRISENKATLIFLPLVFLAIWVGGRFPIRMPSVLGLTPNIVWDWTLLAYCLVAALIPVWTLLQPRGSLGGYFLYITLLAGVLGIVFGGFRVQQPAFHGWSALGKPGQTLFPLLFVTVACGACSGFHSIVSTGTTSKQLRSEPDARVVGYGGMLLEGFVALIALATVMMLAPGSELLKKSPNQIYASGIASFLGTFGIPREQAFAFGLLAFATFVYDTLDVCTRLGRYVFQELTGLRGGAGRVIATVATLAIPVLAVTVKVHDAAGNLVPVWRVFWTLFGASNQLLAALTLLGISVWMKNLGKPWIVSAIPMLFMMVMTVWALVLIVRPWIGWIVGGAAPATFAEGAAAAVLIALALALLVEATAILARRGSSTPTADPA
ncbi:MAG: carbon starvation protein A [Candidatus Eisenbacteria bacterium]|nr:carbon starvation protein A [Candidatus Eisenbacteria bacterium]